MMVFQRIRWPIGLATGAMLVWATAWPFQAAARDLFVAPDGNDHAVGTINAPLATLRAAQEKAFGGDIVYLRGGVYHPGLADISATDANYAIVNDMTKNRVSYLAYNNEAPIFDFSARGGPHFSDRCLSYNPT